MIELHASTDDLADLLGLLRIVPNGLEKATARAINKTLTSTRAYMVKAVREDYAVKAGDVRKELRIRRATWGHLSGSVSGSGSPGIPLLSFVRGSKKAPSTRRLKSGAYRPVVGVPVLIRKDKGRKPAKGVFLARMPSGHIGAFKRVGLGSGGVGWWTKKGRAIKEAYGPSPIKILGSDYYDERIEDFTDETFQKNMQHEADYVLQQMGLR